MSAEWILKVENRVTNAASLGEKGLIVGKIE
jgi:hypothetical protein